jgi:hypothetical protein
MLEIVERSLRLLCPLKVVCLPKQPIQGESFFAELAYEAAKRCESTCQLLDVSKRLWWLHGDNGLYLLWVAFDPSLRDEVAQQLARRYPKRAFLRVELDAVAVEVGEGFSQIVKQAVCFRHFDDDIIDVDLDVAADLFL